MPKLIVLLFGSDATAKTLADALAEGAKGIRFTEVDVRAGERGESPASRLKPLDAVSDLAAYDGIAISCGESAEMLDGMTALLDDLVVAVPAKALMNTIFAITGGNASHLARLAQLGGIVVAEPRGFNDPVARAKAHGARVAKVIEWVRHALSHEQTDHAHHHHH
jgi:hypothetical protein